MSIIRSARRPAARTPVPAPAPTLPWRRSEWSAALPVAPGLYHHRDPADPARVRLGRVRRIAGGTLVARFADVEELVTAVGGEWAGPLAVAFTE